MKQCLSKLRRPFALWRDTKGVAGIEFAIILPVFIMILAGVINFGHVIFIKHSMQNIAGDALREVIYGNIEAADAKMDAEDDLERLVGQFVVQISEDTVTDNVTVSIVADAKSVTLMPFPFTSADVLSDQFRVDITAPRIVQFNPSEV